MEDIRSFRKVPRMKCPHCSKKIGLFSKALNKFGNPKTCPSCQKKIQLSPNLKLVALLIVPLFVAYMYIFKPLVEAMGFSGEGVAGIWAALLVILTMRLQSAES